MKMKTWMAAGVFLLSLGAIFQAYAGDSKQEALDLLAEAQNEGCRICVENLREKAFNLLDYNYYPNLEILSTGPCVFEKSGLGNQLVLACEENTTDNPDYPLVTFLFHTSHKHLVGIDAKDYTTDNQEQAINQAPDKARFTGRIMVLAYPYGDGDAFNFYPSTNHLQIHCRILEMRQLPAGE